MAQKQRCVFFNRWTALAGLVVGHGFMKNTLTSRQDWEAVKIRTRPWLLKACLIWYLIYKGQEVGESWCTSTWRVYRLRFELLCFQNISWFQRKKAKHHSYEWRTSWSNWGCAGEAPELTLTTITEQTPTAKTCSCPACGNSVGVCSWHPPDASTDRNPEPEPPR